MRIGVVVASERGDSLEDLLTRARDLERAGFATAWVPHVFGHDAVTVAAVLGRETRRIEIATAVVPIHPRHPAALAQQALTAALACGGRLTLGIGLSHPVVIEHVLGLSYARRAGHMREYLAVLDPLLRGQPAHFEGEEYRVDLALSLADTPPVPILIAALGERMLEIAGRSASGTVLWMTGPRTIESHIAPVLRAAARDAGRPEPRIASGVQIVLTAKPEPVIERLARRMATYRRLPSYRAMLDREGAEHPTDLALVGDERTLDAGLDRLRDLGVSDFEAVIESADAGERERTLMYLESRL